MDEVQEAQNQANTSITLWVPRHMDGSFVNGTFVPTMSDAAPYLKEAGIEIITEEEHRYQVRLPQGWEVRKYDPFTKIYDRPKTVKSRFVFYTDQVNTCPEHAFLTMHSYS